jgi:hypothetical protein
MRYVAKIHVLDVLDDVVVSGYVFDADPLTDPDHVLEEFTFTARGVGLNDPMAWLLNSLYRCLVAEQRPAGGGPGRGGAVGARTPYLRLVTDDET